MKNTKLICNSFKKISNKDLFLVFIKSNFIQGSWNYEKIQSLGIFFCISHIINKFYKYNKEKKIKSIKRNLIKLNTHPYLTPFMLSILIINEENKFNNTKNYNDYIIDIKTLLTSPLSMFGDLFFWGFIRILFLIMTTYIYINNINIIFSIFIFIIFNVLRIFTKYYLLFYSYKNSYNILYLINNLISLFKKINKFSSILGILMMGYFLDRRKKINLFLNLSKILNINCLFKNLFIKNIINFLFLNLPTILIFSVLTYLFKKNFKPIKVLIFIIIFSFLSCKYNFIL